MNILVLGKGLLGSEIIRQTNWDYLCRKEHNIDVKEFDIWKHKLYSYDVILNCIANTDTYSTDKKSHWDVNYVFVSLLVDFCNENKKKLIHISTDYVYTNSINEASEDDIPIHGNNWYSYTKLIADAYIELKSNNYLICRETHKPNPFPYPKAWADQIGNFDYVNVIVKILIDLIKINTTGVYNIGTELKSMYSLATKTNQVIPCLKPENTPLNTSMNLDKLKNALKRINK